MRSAAVRSALERDPQIGALIVEPVQGRGGVIVPPAGFLRGLRALCDERALVLILDEIYTGFGRTGTMFACEREAVVPDLLCVGKALAGGVPLAATIGTPRVMDAWPVSAGEALHTSTFLGNPLACAAALANLDELARLGVVAQVARAKAGWPSGCRPSRRRRACARCEASGSCGRWSSIAAEFANQVVVHGLARGVILLQSGPTGTSITIAPPLAIEDAAARTRARAVRANHTGIGGRTVSKLRVGIVGSGFGGDVHAPAYALHPRFEVVAIASPASAERVARERKIPHAFRSAAEMLAGIELDVVSVASPPFDHHPSVIAALAAGKHVLCEKPFALNLAQAQEMTAAAERAGTVAALAFEFRYVPAVRALKELIDNGHAGALRELEVARLGRDLRAANTGRERGWWFSAAAGGGVANATMPHFFDLANHLAGRAPRATTGLLRTANPRRTDAQGEFESTVADGAFAYVDYGDGLVARVSSDSTTIVESTTIAVHGETRSAVANGTFFNDLRVYAIAEDDQDELEIAGSPYGKYASVHGNLPFFLPLLDAFAERIDLGAPGVPTFADGLTTQRQLEAIGYGP